jgi:hypothetical protein
VADSPEDKPKDPASSGSVDVAVSQPEMPASASGSVDVAFSSSAIPKAVSAVDTAPVNEAGRSKRITKAVQDVVTGGVEKLGAGIETLGGGVAKVGDLTAKVPLVGPSVGKLGEGLTRAGESIHALPRVAQTRRGRLLVRSVLVGFCLVFSWIAVIVFVQLRAQNTPDFRPAAEKILVEISSGKAGIEKVYEESSPRFQEVWLKERFVDLMLDLNATNGAFREITAINETLVSNGPTGRVGRVSLTALYEHGITRGSVNFHLDPETGTWKFLGIGIEVPESVTITQADREKRVAACLDDKGKDVSDQRAKCDVRDAAETILEMIRDGKAGEVWDSASDIFKQQETRTNFIRIHDDMRGPLGLYKRLLNVTEAKSIGGLTAYFDVVAEFEKSSGVRVVFNFSRPSKTAKWQLRSLKVVVPMPRPDEGRAVVPNPDIHVDEPPLMREVPMTMPPADAGASRSGAAAPTKSGSRSNPGSSRTERSGSATTPAAP